MSLANFQNQSGLRNKATFFCAIVVLLVVGLACEQSKNVNVNQANQTVTPNPSPTQANVNPTNEPITPKPTPTVAVYKSSGLGKVLTAKRWKTAHLS